jgi:hypothetical protein
VLNLNEITFSKRRSSLIVKCLEIPHYEYLSRWQPYTRTKSIAMNKIIPLGFLSIILTGCKLRNENQTAKEKQIEREIL